MKITNHPQQPADGSDWVAWLQTDDGIHVLVQIGYQANEARAREIVEQIAASHTPAPVRRFLDALADGDRAEVAESLTDLNNWIVRGGMLPDDPRPIAIDTRQIRVTND